jgi:hypothetical protein
VDFQVTCSDDNGDPITCPGEPQPSIVVQTDFSTAQAITNPGYLTTPIGQNQWTNILTDFFSQGPLIKAKGKTSGFSEFVVVDLGAQNPQGLAKFTIVYPKFPITIKRGSNIPIEIELTSVATGKTITDAKVNISVVKTADAHGRPIDKGVLSTRNVFHFKELGTGNGEPLGVYTYDLKAAKYGVGTYSVTIYGNAFPAYQGQFKIVK